MYSYYYVESTNTYNFSADDSFYEKNLVTIINTSGKPPQILLNGKLILPTPASQPYQSNFARIDRPAPMALQDVSANIVKPAPITSKDASTKPSTEVTDSHDDDDGIYLENCDAIRRKINAFLRTGEMKVTHFQRMLDINSNSYGRFMKLKGPWSGIDNQTFDAAYHFFRQRKAEGKKTPKTSRARKSASEDDQIAAIKAIHIPGEETGNVPVYDTCDEIRRKINVHIRGNETQASLARAITAISEANGGPKIVSSQIATFLKKKGPREGNFMGLFYAAYVYFEKLRLKDGQPKTKHRQEMEGVWGANGFDIDERSNVTYLCSAYERPIVDKYGKVTFR